MRARVHPGDNKGVGHYRLIWPAKAAEQHGVDVEFAGSLPIKRYGRNGRGWPVIGPSLEVKGDVLVFQRPSARELVALIPALQAQGHAVVVDVDDDLSAIDPRNAAAGDEHPQTVARACALADLVTVSTPALARRYGAHGRVIVLENCVPAGLLEMPRTSDGRTVGWSGWTGSHPDDLPVTRGGVGHALADTGARFHVVGRGDRVAEQLHLHDEPTATGGLPIGAYHLALGALDVGICPLRDTAFNRAKSWLKPLEMAARGAAVVMSPVAEYEALTSEGIGVLAADKARAWRARVRELISDPGLRSAQAAAAREVIAERHTYETQGWRWAEAWSAAIANHRARHKPMVAA